MRRYLYFAVFMPFCISCVSDPEKVPLPPLPNDGTVLSYVEVLARLRVQTVSARDDHFLNQWDKLAEVARGLEQSAAYLPKSQDVPANRRNTIQRDSATLIAAIRQLQTAAKMKEEAQSLELIRRIHNQIRDFEELPK